MTNLSGSVSATEFTSDWAQFEDRLAGFLEKLACYTLSDIIRLRYPTIGKALGEIIVDGTIGVGAADMALEPRDGASSIGVSVTLPDGSPRFYPTADDPGQASEVASVICTFLREEALVAHPTLLTAEAEHIGWALLDLLGLPGPEGVPSENTEPPPRKPRQVARRGDHQRDTVAGGDSASEQSWPELSWPKSVDEVHEAVEQVLVLKYDSAPLDVDGDFVVDSTAEGGARFYLTVINDGPMIAFRKAVVIHVKSRQSAVIEANYLNRGSADIRWVLRGYALYQELSFPTNPFVPVRFAEMLDQFGEQYRDNVSALRMRLGDE